ncbi:MAG: FAS1-like dehydratase domain-containing protein [Burkholderiaceae bacterium]
MSKDHEGKAYPSFRLKPRRELVRKYWQSLGEDPDSALLPLTYLIFLRGAAHGVDLFADLDIPRELALHGGQRYEWFSPIAVDDELEVSVRVERIAEKASKAGPLWFADVSYEYRLVRNGEVALREITRLIKRSPK